MKHDIHCSIGITVFIKVQLCRFCKHNTLVLIGILHNSVCRLSGRSRKYWKR